MRDAEIVVELSDDEVRLLAMEATLLVLGLSSVLSLRSPHNQHVDLSPTSGDVRATIRMRNTDHAQVGIPSNQIEYLQMFLMRAYRDGMAEVNHIHLEGTCNGKSKDLTFMFHTSAAPLSPEEAAKLMDE